MTFPTPNADEDLVSRSKKPSSTCPAVFDEAPFIGNFHKSLPHNKYGEVDPASYRKFERVCIQVEAGAPINFEDVSHGPLAPSVDVPQTAFILGASPTPEIENLTKSAAKFVSPLAGASTETHGLDPKVLEMFPAPGCRSITAMAEMMELYWMALLRDAPLLAFQADRSPPDGGCADISDHDAALGYNVVGRVNDARKIINTVFDCAVSHDSDPGKLRTPLDVEIGPGGAEIIKRTLFRSGLHDEEVGPLVSQFFLRPIGYGVQNIDQKQVPYIAKTDFLTNHGDWLLAQNTGKDKYGRDYGNCNNYADQLHRGASYYPSGNPKRHISTMRDLARFVNRDALHQAYFNAALFLDGIGAPLDAGNPYGGHRYSRELAFASLGGPDLLTLVSEVASRALKVVWRQKWLVHRRCRPEVFGGLIQMQINGFDGTTRAYGLKTTIVKDKCSDSCKPADFNKAVQDTFDAVSAHNSGTLFLPMAFSAGSPNHPAYGAGHATVAGACVTVLKAWFDEDAKLKCIFEKANEDADAGKIAPKDPPGGGKLMLLQPGYRKSSGGLEDFCEPQEYNGFDAECMTVGGELNKIASNVAMGRSMGGVHWRTDNTRSLRLGEEIAIEILRKRTAEYAERPVSFTFRSFDRHKVHITKGQVRKD